MRSTTWICRPVEHPVIRVLTTATKNRQRKCFITLHLVVSELGWRSLYSSAASKQGHDLWTLNTL